MYGAQRVAQRNLSNMRLSVAKINGSQDEVGKKRADHRTENACFCLMPEILAGAPGRFCGRFTRLKTANSARHPEPHSAIPICYHASGPSAGHP